MTAQILPFPITEIRWGFFSEEYNNYFKLGTLFKPKTSTFSTQEEAEQALKTVLTPKEISDIKAYIRPKKVFSRSIPRLIELEPL